ncbi:MAG: hypothetical protein STSR0007_02470 [Thermovirga sp.]
MHKIRSYGFEYFLHAPAKNGDGCKGRTKAETGKTGLFDHKRQRPAGPAQNDIFTTL